MPRSRSPSSPFLWHLRHGNVEVGGRGRGGGGGFTPEMGGEGCARGTEDERASPSRRGG